MRIYNTIHLASGYRLQNGKYRIEKKIGQGGFGITYLARWYQKVQGAMGEANSYSIVVIKEFFLSKYCNRYSDGHNVFISTVEGKEMMTHFKEKLKKEGKIISKLSHHPNIVSILDVFEENNTVYLVMQYIEGESLSDMIDRLGTIDEPTALKYVKQICSALSETHSRRILHLDMKPSNVLIDEDNNVQIIDFGISKQYDESANETSNTPLGVSLGYSPIEQYGTLKSFLPSTDIYSLGATMYKMLTGKTPLEATSRSQIDLEPVRFFNPNISKNTEKVITKAMSEKSRDRFQKIQEFWQALNKEEVTVSHDYANSIKNNNNDNPQKNKIQDDTLIEKKSKKINNTPVIFYEPEPSMFWKKTLVGVSGIAAVLAVIFFLTGGMRITEYVEQIKTPLTGNNWPVIVAETTVHNQDTIIQTITQQPVSQPKLKEPTDSKVQKEQARKEKERLLKEKEENDEWDAINLVQQANNVFINRNLGSVRFEQSYQLYMRAKELNGDVSAGYGNFLSLAKSLIENGSGFDSNVKKTLQYAQKMNNTQEVRDLLAKCN